VNAELWLPDSEGGAAYTMRDRVTWYPPSSPPTTRVAYAAAHVVADPLADNAPSAPAVIDWDTTLAFRRHLWSYGFGVADAMDTAQRGMGLGWVATQELIRRSAAEARACGGAIAVGAGTDHLGPEGATLAGVIAGYEQQVAVAEDAGARVILMASRLLAAVARGPDDYEEVYGRVLSQVTAPVILHWLGPMFDPALVGYWGNADVGEATETFLAVIRQNADHIDGVKVSLLDAGHEVQLRRALPAGVRMYTGDDFNYPELIRGDEHGHSDALLGILAAIAPVAAQALQALDRADPEAYDRTLAPTLPLARHVFGAPTLYYKTGIAFLVWLAGLQPGFVMVGGLQSGRSVLHLAQTFRLADAAGLLPDPELAVARMRALLAVAGVGR